MRLDTPFDALYLDEPPRTYRLDVPGRWAAHDLTHMLEGETFEHYAQRMRVNAAYWAQRDTLQAAKEDPPNVVKRPRGRPHVYPVVEGESANERRLRLNRLNRAAKPPRPVPSISDDALLAVHARDPQCTPLQYARAVLAEFCHINGIPQ